LGWCGLKLLLLGLRERDTDTVSPALLGWCGLKQKFSAKHLTSALCFTSPFGLVRIETWRPDYRTRPGRGFTSPFGLVRIETFIARVMSCRNSSVSPALLGWCGLKPASPE